MHELSHLAIISYICIVLSIGSICTSGEIRLVGGPTSEEGRVDICSNGNWTQICDSSWTVMDANVACRQLGFSLTGIMFSL